MEEAISASFLFWTCRQPTRRHEIMLLCILHKSKSESLYILPIDFIPKLWYNYKCQGGTDHSFRDYAPGCADISQIKLTVHEVNIPRANKKILKKHLTNNQKCVIIIIERKEKRYLKMKTKIYNLACGLGGVVAAWGIMSYIEILVKTSNFGVNPIYSNYNLWIGITKVFERLVG